MAQKRQNNDRLGQLVLWTLTSRKPHGHVKQQRDVSLLFWTDGTALFVYTAKAASEFDQPRQRNSETGKGQLDGSWILTSRQPQRVTRVHRTYLLTGVFLVTLLAALPGLFY